MGKKEGLPADGIRRCEKTNKLSLLGMDTLPFFRKKGPARSFCNPSHFTGFLFTQKHLTSDEIYDILFSYEKL
jgi:hypothetical protein